MNTESTSMWRKWKKKKNNEEENCRENIHTKNDCRKLFANWMAAIQMTLFISSLY